MTRRRIMLAATMASLVAPAGFAQMKYSRTRSPSPTPTATPQQQATPAQMQPRVAPISGQRTTAGPRTAPIGRTSPTPAQKTTQMPGQLQPRQVATAAPTPAKPTPTPVPPPDIQAYLDRQVASSKDKKFHMTVNGKDLALTPFHTWSQRSTGPNTTSTVISMRSDEGRVYDIEFMTTGAQVTSIGIRRINGESVR